MFAKRIRRAISNESCRHYFGLSPEEHVFAPFPDVIKTLEWIESGGQGEYPPPQGERQRPTLRRMVGNQAGIQEKPPT
jgi:hypothetical protein